VPKSKHDFAGWVTKNDIHCTDGVTIKQDAFKDNDGTKVPLVWNHNYTSPTNVLGHVVLQNHKQGIYGYGHFNDTEEAKSAKEMVRHGDIISMSIGARKIKRNGNDVIHGQIYEVSLVLAGANPGATIESIITHGETDEEKGVITLDTLIHASEDVVDYEEEEMKNEAINQKDKTVGDVLGSLNEEQLAAVIMLLEGLEDDDDDYDDDDDNDDEELELKQNIFSNHLVGNEEVLTHADQEILLAAAKDGKVDSFRDYLMDYSESVLQHGITNIEYLFPEAHNLDNEPRAIVDNNTGFRKIIEGVRKSPFANIKTMTADLTADEARAKGYIKGSEKLEQIFPIMKRETSPTTIYKKQKLDRDDIVDITSFDVVRYINREMRYKLEEEIARAILVGDGREISSPDKVKEDKIRPIISDADFYTIKKTYPDAAGFVEAVIKAMAEYEGSGNPTLFIDRTLLADVKLLKGTDGRYLTGTLPTNAALAAHMDIGDIVPTTFMTGHGALAVNLADYTVGSSKGGEITSFDDFDIDFNKYTYLVETRLSGALTVPKSAIHFAPEEEPVTP
jgi:HK97 family phage prohead protease/HK97 family phage major capsid protein